MNALNHFAKEVVDCSRIAEVFGELALNGRAQAV